MVGVSLRLGISQSCNNKTDWLFPGERFLAGMYLNAQSPLECDIQLYSILKVTTFQDFIFSVFQFPVSLNCSVLSVISNWFPVKYSVTSLSYPRISLIYLDLWESTLTTGTHVCNLFTMYPSYASVMVTGSSLKLMTRKMLGYQSYQTGWDTVNPVELKT